MYTTKNVVFLELPNDIESLKELVVSLLARVSTLEEENACLRAQVNQNSRNSSLPPSKDKYKVKPAFPQGGTGQKGGQQGHQGKTLTMSQQPDHLIELAAPVRCSCGADLSQVEPVLKACRQVFDLPAPKLEVSEYRQYERSCPCCRSRQAGAFPALVTAPVQYGPGVWALCTLLNTSFHLSCSHISELFEDLYGLPLNQATVLNATERAYQSLEASEEAVKAAVLSAGVAHFDETGIACQGATFWLHTACTSLCTYLFVHAKRGVKALESGLSLLKDFKNRAVHDCYASYFTFPSVSHGLCNAHLLRELQAQIEAGAAWAVEMKALLLDLYRASDKGRGSLAKEQMAPYLARYAAICKQADQQEPPPQKPPRGKSKRSKGRNLLERLVKHKQAVLAFAMHPEVPFTNNQAERDIRPVKGKIKTAGCFRTELGASYYARIQGFVSTARKQGKQVFNELKMAYSGNTFLTEKLEAAK